MCKQRVAGIFLVLLVCLLFVSPLSKGYAASEDTKSTSVLLMYDSLAMGTQKEGNVEAFQRLIASFGVQVTIMSYDEYTSGTLAHFNKVIGIRNADDVLQLPEQFNQDMNVYSGDYMHIGSQLPTNIQNAMGVAEKRVVQDTFGIAIGPFNQSSITADSIAYITQFTGKSYGLVTSEKQNTSYPYAVQNGKYAYIPYMVKGNLSEQAPAFVLKDWLSVQISSHSYVVLNEIYPFSDLELLNQMADRLYEAGIPFIASVQPVISNLDFPAMQRYLETLKHIQSRNGTIVVNAPVVASTISQDITVLKSQISAFLDALANYGIVPLGAGTELYWTYDQHYTENGLPFFDSGVIFPNDRLMYRAQTDQSREFPTSVYTMKAADINKYMTSTQSLDSLPMNMALVYPFPETENEMTTTLDDIFASWTTFADYKNEAHTVRTATNVMTSRSGELEINGQAVLLNNQMKEIDSDHAYVQEVKKSFTTLFSVQNNIFIVLILTTLLIFIAFLIIGYRLYKQKFTL
jgi:uncharacterized protein YdaL